MLKWHARAITAPPFSLSGRALKQSLRPAAAVFTPLSCPSTRKTQQVLQHWQPAGPWRGWPPAQAPRECPGEADPLLGPPRNALERLTPCSGPPGVPWRGWPPARAPRECPGEADPWLGPPGVRWGRTLLPVEQLFPVWCSAVTVAPLLAFSPSVTTARVKTGTWFSRLSGWLGSFQLAQSHGSRHH